MVWPAALTMTSVPLSRVTVLTFTPSAQKAVQLPPSSAPLPVGKVKAVP